MAARVLLRHTAAPFLATTMVLTIPTVAFAEAPSSSQPPSQSHPASNKKPIYDSLPPLPSTIPASPPQHPTSTTADLTHAITPTPSDHATPLPTTTTTTTRSRGPTPTDRLAAQIKTARLWLHSRAVTAEDGVNALLTRAFSLERSFTDTVAGLAPARESGERLMPGGIYVLVAAMAGSVVARNRGVLLRTATPVVLGVVAAKAFVPVTTRNVGDLVWEWEKKVPPVAEAHQGVSDGVERGVRFAKVHAELGRAWVEEKVGSARAGVEGWVKKGK